MGCCWNDRRLTATLVFDFEDLADRAWDTGVVPDLAVVLALEPVPAVVALWADFFLDRLFDAAGFVFAAGVCWAIRIPAVNSATVKVIVLKGKPQHTKVAPRRVGDEPPRSRTEAIAHVCTASPMRKLGATSLGSPARNVTGLAAFRSDMSSPADFAESREPPGRRPHRPA